MTVKMAHRISPRLLRGAACAAVLAMALAIVRLVSPYYGQQTRFVLIFIYFPLGTLSSWALIRLIETARNRERNLIRRLEEEITLGKQLCFSSIEALAYAVEGRVSRSVGHLSRVQSFSVATAQALGMTEDDIQGVRVAALAHDIGRLGVPDNIFAKEGALTEEEREKIRAYPVLGGRLLATIPFPWPVVPMVRHHREHFDGTGYPDGLSGGAIPLGARILSVVDAYDAMTSRGAYGIHRSHREALEQLTGLAGSQFDPEVVGAFILVVDKVRTHLERTVGQAGESAALEIAHAQREVQALYELACSVGATLCMEETLSVLMRKVMGIIQCSTCVIYLTDENEQYLHAIGAAGANERFLMSSYTRYGTYLTGRVASRDEPLVTGFMPGDIEISESEDAWEPLRSTLIVPLRSEAGVIGTMNLYHSEPDAFQADDLRMMMIVGALAGKALNNARLFAQTQETAFTDPVTGLRNRRYVRQFLDQEVNRAIKNRHSLALLGMDLDRFKQVNDSYGHEMGDRVLREIGEVMQGEIRNYDLAARYAGDEFAVVLPETTREQAEIVARKIMDAVDRYAERKQQFDPRFPRVGVSVGVAVFPQDAEDLTRLLARADEIMYENKRARKERRAA